MVNEGIRTLNGQVNVSVANLYSEGTYRSETISQAIMGEHLEIQDTDDDFALVRTPDGYSGWMSNFQWVERSPDKEDKVILRSHFTTILAKPEKNAVKLRDAVLGTQLIKVDEKPDWIQVQLPDGIMGWIDKKDVGLFAEKTRNEVVEIASEFLGYPYFWGGKTPKGFDCSGLIQVIFALTGTKMRRDSWMQHHDAKLVGENPEQAQAGDLYFFSEDKDKISHVGIALGDFKILHARGFVQINSLEPQDKKFDQKLLNTFVDVRTCFD